MQINLLLAFSAGLLSFFSPCVLPLIPIYLSTIVGVSTSNRRKTFVNAVGFVLGFTVIFVLLGFSAVAAGKLLSSLSLEVLGVVISLEHLLGVIVIVFGLHLMGVLKIPLLYRENRPHVTAHRGSFIIAILLGGAFAFGWTPCVGPLLAGTLALASQEETATQGALLLFTYSFGLAVPFLLMAAGIKYLSTWVARFRRFFRGMEVISALLLLAVGVLVLVSASSPGRSVPEFSVSLVDTGEVITNDELRGKFSLLIFWATWCEPCVQEIPDLNDFYEARCDEVELLAISVDKWDAQSLDSWMRENGMLYPVALGDKKLARQFGMRGLPFSVLISPDGKILERLTGPHSREDLEKILNRYY